MEGWDSAFYVADAGGAIEERQPSFDLLSDNPPATGSVDHRTADAFGRIPLLVRQ